VFLINLCGGLKEIGMTSCKDGGSLTIQKYNEYEYQVFTFGCVGSWWNNYNKSIN
jgi:hypothetical protein